MKIIEARKLLESNYFDFSYSVKKLKENELLSQENIGGLAYYFEENGLKRS